MFKYTRLLNDTLFKENPITLWELITWIWDHSLSQVEHDLRKWYDQEVGAIYDDGPLDQQPKDTDVPIS
jgi:hypothetical protein